MDMDPGFSVGGDSWLMILKNLYCVNLMYVYSNLQEISGEIYEVDDKLLNFLDDFEETPTVYQRVRVEVTVESGKMENISIYLYQ